MPTRAPEDEKWTLGTLYLHLTALIENSDRRSAENIAAQEKMVGLALDSARIAVGKAEAATEKRLESVNEFRASMGDQASRLIPRAEAEQRICAVSERVDENNAKIDKLTERLDQSAGRSAGYNNMVGYIGAAAGLVGIAFGIVAFFVRK